jgi:hypothetical protein
VAGEDVSGIGLFGARLALEVPELNVRPPLASKADVVPPNRGAGSLALK